MIAGHRENTLPVTTLSGAVIAAHAVKALITFAWRCAGWALQIRADGRVCSYSAKDLVKLPKDVSLEQAALTEPLSVGLHAINKININRDDKYLILGAGTIGLVVLALLKIPWC